MAVLSPQCITPSTQPSPSSTSSTPTATTPTPLNIAQVHPSSPSSPSLSIVRISVNSPSESQRPISPESSSPLQRSAQFRPLRRMSSTGTKIKLPQDSSSHSVGRRMDAFGLQISTSEGPYDDVVIGGECGLENRGEASSTQTLPNENWIAHHLSAVLQHSFSVSSPHPIIPEPSTYPPTHHSPPYPAHRVLDSLRNKLSLNSLSSFTASNTTDEDEEEADEDKSQASAGSSGSYLKSSDSEHPNLAGRSPTSLSSSSSSSPRLILNQLTNQSLSSTSRPVLLKLLNTWSFDANTLSSAQIRSSLHILLSVFIKYNPTFSRQLEMMGVERPESSLAGLVRNLEAAYDPRNAYHNFRHAVDVVQAVYTILSHEGVVPPLGWVIKREMDGNESMTWNRQPAGRMGLALDDMTVWALLLAAAGHDVGHPGLSNAFMVNARTPIAYVFSDGAVLENFHRITFTRMLRDHGFQKLVDGHLGFRRVLTGCVLATDMGRHFPIVEELKQLHCSWEQSSIDDALTEERALSEKVLIAAGIIKCGDISNSSRPHPISLSWSSCLLSEWSRQAALEAELQLPISVVTLDRTEKRAQAKSQVGFTSLFALPLFSVMEQLGPRSFQPFAENCRLGLKTWQKVVDHIDSTTSQPASRSATAQKLPSSRPHLQTDVNGDEKSISLSRLQNSARFSDTLSPRSAIPALSPLGSTRSNSSGVRLSNGVDNSPNSGRSLETTVPETNSSIGQVLSDEDELHLTPKPACSGWWESSSLSADKKAEESNLSMSSNSVWTVRNISVTESSERTLTSSPQPGPVSSTSLTEPGAVSPSAASISPRHLLKIRVPLDPEAGSATAAASNPWQAPFSDDSKANSVADDASFSSFGSPSSPSRSPFFTPGVSSASSVESTGDSHDQRPQNSGHEVQPLPLEKVNPKLTPISLLRPSQRPRDKGMSVDYGLAVRNPGGSSFPLRRQAYSPYLVNQQVACARGCGKVTAKCVKCGTESKIKMHRSLSLAKAFFQIPSQARTPSSLGMSDSDNNKTEGMGEKVRMFSQPTADQATLLSGCGAEHLESTCPTSQVDDGTSNLKSDHSWPPYPFRPWEL